MDFKSQSVVDNLMKEELKKVFFGYDEETQEYLAPVDDEFRYFEMPEGATIQTAGSYATKDIWTLTYNGQTYIATKGDYDSVEIQ